LVIVEHYNTIRMILAIILRVAGELAVIREVIHQCSLYWFLCTQSRAQRAMGIEVASRVWHRRSLDHSRWRPVKQLAGMDEKL